MNSLLVKDVMAKHPPALEIGAALVEAVDILLKHHMSGLPVVNDDQCVVGFVSEQDCLRTMLVSSYHDEGGHKVEDVMNVAPMTVHLEDSIVDVAQLMVRERPKVYPVVDEGGRLVGLLLRRQGLVALKNNRAHVDIG